MAKKMNLIADSTTSVENGDILFEIFLRLTWRLIFQLRLVSKQWLSILSDPNFISTWMKNNDFKPWMTMIYGTTLPVSDYVTTSTTNAYSGFISGMFSLGFVSSSVHPKKLYILGVSNNGLVLCSTTKLQHTELYVCNPLLKQYVMLPKAVVTCKVSVFMGLVCASSSELVYKAIRVPQFCKAKRNFKIEIYSSDLDKWSAYEVSCDEAVSMPESLRRRNFDMIEHNGVLYWSEGQGDRIIAFEMENKNIEEDDGSNQRHCRVIVLPHEAVQPGSEKCLTEFKGSIACIHCNTLQMSIWVLQEDTNNVWVRRFHLTRPYSYSMDYIFRPVAFDSVTQSVVTLEIFTKAKSCHVSTQNIEETRRSTIDRVPNNPYNASHFIKASVLNLLPTPPICN